MNAILTMSSRVSTNIAIPMIVANISEIPTRSRLVFLRATSEVDITILKETSNIVME